MNNETFTPAELAAIRVDLAECEMAFNILTAAKKVADAAVEWADAFPGYEAGASGSGEYLRAREVLLRAHVREYRALTEGEEKA